MREKGIPEALVRAVMSLYKGARTKAKVGTHLSKELVVNVGAHLESAKSPLFFDIVFDFATNEIKQGMLQVIFYVDDIVVTKLNHIKLHLKPYYGVAGSFLSPSNYFAIDS